MCSSSHLDCDTMVQCWADIRVSGDMFVHETINGMQKDMGHELNGRFRVL